MANRYGITEGEWTALTPAKRVFTYNRWRLRHSKCDHEALLEDWPEALQEAYSFDPYAHTRHGTES